MNNTARPIIRRRRMRYTGWIIFIVVFTGLGAFLLSQHNRKSSITRQSTSSTKETKEQFVTRRVLEMQKNTNPFAGTKPRQTPRFTVDHSVDKSSPVSKPSANSALDDYELTVRKTVGQEPLSYKSVAELEWILKEAKKQQPHMSPAEIEELTTKTSKELKEKQIQVELENYRKIYPNQEAKP